jgi:TatD DNase family protein
VEKSVTSALIDTHCHLDAYPNAVGVLSAATSADIEVVAVTNTPDAYRRLATLLPRSGPARPALGLHPLHAGRLGMTGVLRFSRQAAQAAWIGEIGLDFSPAGRATRTIQLTIFEALLALPQLRDRPVTVHSRGAERETIERLVTAGTRAILHWYTGPLAAADDAIAAGLSFSVNPAMVTSAKGRALLAWLPHDRILLETDGPYARRAGKPCEPADLAALTADLAHLWQATSAYVRDTIVDNQQRLLA